MPQKNIKNTENNCCRKNKLKIATLIPAGTSKYNDAVMDSMKNVVPPDVVVDVFNLGAEAHDCIECRTDWTQNAYPAVKKAIELEQLDYNGIWLCDFDMCGVEAARESLSIPIVGGFTAAADTVLSLCQKFSIITILDSTIDMQWDHIYRYSMQDNCVSIRSINVYVGDMHKNDPSSSRPHSLSLLSRLHAHDSPAEIDDEEIIARMVKQSYEAIEKDGAQAILLGCTGFTALAEKISYILNKRITKKYIPVIDTNHAGISCTISLARMNLHASALCYVPIKKRK